MIRRVECLSNGEYLQVVVSHPFSPTIVVAGERFFKPTEASVTVSMFFKIGTYYSPAMLSTSAWLTGSAAERESPASFFGGGGGDNSSTDEARPRLCFVICEV